MRIISQDGMYDFPYDNTCISLDIRNKKKIIAWSFCSDNEVIYIATYSTEHKALKAMEMLREEYQKYYSNNGGGMMATAEFYVQPFAFNHPKVFQFPKDEEIEV